MEPITIISTAIALATPYLIKSGESVAEKIGEEVWELLKKPFTKEKREELFVAPPEEKQLELIKKELLVKITDDPEYRKELLQTISRAQANLNQQNINNQGKVEKQINIQTNSGNIKF